MLENKMQYAEDGKILAACVLLWEDGKFLSVSRKDNPNLVGLPGGKLNDGESPQQAAVRETLEETGIEVEILEYEGAFATVEGDYVVYCYIAQRKEGVEPKPIDPSETGRVRWVTIEELITESAFNTFNKNALTHFCYINNTQ